MSTLIDGLTPPDIAATAAAAAIDVSGQATVVFAAAGLLCLAARRAPARIRHGIWVAAFAATAALPLLAAIDAPLRVGSSVATAAASIWLLGVAALAARRVRATLRLHRAAADAEIGPHVPGATTLIGGDLPGPVTFGMPPRVLLPPEFPSWPASERRLVLLHEGAHVARRDWTVLTLATAWSSLMWFHPAFWIARRFLILEAERAADEAVLRAGERPSDYAQLLLNRAVAVSPLPALAARKWLDIRVRSLLGAAPTGGRGAVLGIVAVLAMPPLLSGWTIAPAAQEPHCEPTTTELPPIRDGGSDTALSASVHRAVQARVDALSDADLAELHAQADVLVRNCPYNRSLAGMPRAFQEALEPHFALIDDRRVRDTSPALAARLGHLRDAFAAHRELIAAVGLETLPAPRPGDYLYGRPLWSDAPSPRPAMASGGAAETRARYEQIRELVDAYPDDVKARIDAANEVMLAGTEARWPMKRELVAYRVTLNELSALARHFGEHGRDDLRGAFLALADTCDDQIELASLLMSLYC